MAEGATVTAGTAEKHIYAGQEWTADHPLNVRISIPLFFGQYYVTVVAGKERRTRARLACDRRQHPLETPRNFAFIFLIGAVATSGSLAFAYLILAQIFSLSGRLIF